MPVRKLLEYLDHEQVKYVTIRHSVAYTAQEIAESAHVSGDMLAKTVVVELDGVLALAVLRAPDRVDLDLLRGAARAKAVNLADEADFKDRFPGVETGAMPPFGNLYDMQVFVDESLARDERIAFNAGNHTELIKLAYKDFERLVEPRVASFTR